MAIPGHTHLLFAYVRLVNEICGLCNASVAGLLVPSIQHSLRLQVKNPETTVTELKPEANQLVTEYMTVHFHTYWVCLYYRY